MITDAMLPCPCAHLKSPSSSCAVYFDLTPKLSLPFVGSLLLSVSKTTKVSRPPRERVYKGLALAKYPCAVRSKPPKRRTQAGQDLDAQVAR